MPKITALEFDNLLIEVVDATPAEVLLTVPGVYEELSEYFNNTVLDLWDARAEEE